MTHMCVKLTTLEAFNLGCAPTVVPDGSATSR